MEYSNFLEILLPYQKFQREVSELHDIGIDLFEGKYKLSETVFKMFNNTMHTLFTEDGVEWVEWFIFESDWGHRDWSQLRMMVDGELIEKDPADIYGARDEDGNPICYSIESLWEYVKQYLKQ
jgi:hypothetical protein